MSRNNYSVFSSTAVTLFLSLISYGTVLALKITELLISHPTAGKAYGKFFSYNTLVSIKGVNLNASLSPPAQMPFLQKTGKFSSFETSLLSNLSEIHNQIQKLLRWRSDRKDRACKACFVRKPN